MNKKERKNKSNKKRISYKWLIFLLSILVIGIGFFVWDLKQKDEEIVTETIEDKSTEEIESMSAEENSAPSSQPKSITSTNQSTSQQNAASTKIEPAKTSIPRPTISPLSKEISIGNQSRKRIALTFDAGSGAAQTPQILDILRQNNIHVSISLTGKWIEQNPELVRRMITEGHTFINHTYNHPYLTKISDDQIGDEFERTETALHTVDSNAVMKPYFRPPYGDRNQHVWNYAASLGYQSIYWTVDAWDWKTDATTDLVKQRIFDNAKNGAIILMHVGDDLTPQVLPEVIKTLQDRGFELGNLESVLE